MEKKDQIFFIETEKPSENDSEKKEFKAANNRWTDSLMKPEAEKEFSSEPQNIMDIMKLDDISFEDLCFDFDIEVDFNHDRRKSSTNFLNENYPKKTDNERTYTLETIDDFLYPKKENNESGKRELNIDDYEPAADFMKQRDTLNPSLPKKTGTNLQTAGFIIMNNVLFQI